MLPVAMATNSMAAKTVNRPQSNFKTKLPVVVVTSNMAVKTVNRMQSRFKISYYFPLTRTPLQYMAVNKPTVFTHKTKSPSRTSCWKLATSLRVDAWSTSTGNIASCDEYEQCTSRDRVAYSCAVQH